MSGNTLTKITFLKRILVIIYESVLLFAIYMLAGLPVTFIFQVILEPTLPIIQQPKYLLYLLYIFAVFFLYFGFCWTRSGQTLAMKAWKCKLTNEDGSLLNWSQALKRYLLALISWGVLGIGFLIGLVRKDRCTFHDLVSKSYIYKLQ